MKQVLATDFTADELQAICLSHLIWAKDAKHTSGVPHWDSTGLNVIGIRMNPITGFYVKGKGDWNDHLYLVQGTMVVHFACTVDPAVVIENKKGIAHLDEGCWDAYIKGSHKTAGRLALVQRANPVRVTRTNAKGAITMSEWGMFGINIHNAAGLFRPSAGCTVIQPKRGFMAMDENYKVFKNLLLEAPDRPSRTYFLLNHDQLKSYGYEIVNEVA